MFNQLFPIIAPVVFLSAIGFGWARSGKEFPSEFISRLVMNFSAPCLLLSTVGHADVSREALAAVSAATVLTILIMAMAAYLLARLLKLTPNAYATSMAFSNCGNMGLPLCLFAFGDQGMVLALAWFTTMALLQFTFGIWWMSNVGAADVLKDLARKPLIYAAVAAALMMAFDLSLPQWAQNTTGLLGQAAVPLMLLTLGVSLSTIQLGDIKLSLLFGALRIAGGFSVGLLVVWLLDLSGITAGVVILQAAMPVAVFNYLLALRYQRSPQVIAGLVFCSTLLSFISLPLVIIYAQSL
ncbi:MAG: putative permease [Gammaproteobacteria bacterium]|jgi:predicted permease